MLRKIKLQPLLPHSLPHRREGSELNLRGLGLQSVGLWEPSKICKSEIQGIELNGDQWQKENVSWQADHLQKASLICKDLSEPSMKCESRISTEQGTQLYSAHYCLCCCLVAKLCPTLCDPICPSGSSVHKFPRQEYWSELRDLLQDIENVIYGLLLFLISIYLFGSTGPQLWYTGSLVAACKLLVAAFRIQFPGQGSNPGPLHWEHGVLASGPPGSPYRLLFYSFSQCFSHDKTILVIGS